MLHPWAGNENTVTFFKKKIIGDFYPMEWYDNSRSSPLKERRNCILL